MRNPIGPDAPAAAPVDYPPAVLKEAEDAMREASGSGRFGYPRSERSEEQHAAATIAGAQAYADVLARHVVAARLAAADTTPAILTFDEKRAGQFTVQPSASGSFTLGSPGPISYHVKAGVPVYLDLPIGEGGTHTRTVEARTEIARLMAERNAWARYARAFVNRTWHGASGTPSSLAAVAELNAACEALRALGIDPGEAAR
jgi:hypothetical protein